MADSTYLRAVVSFNFDLDSQWSRFEYIFFNKAQIINLILKAIYFSDFKWKKFSHVLENM